MYFVTIDILIVTNTMYLIKRAPYPWLWANDISNMWRMYNDAGDSQGPWSMLMAVVDLNKELFAFAGPGGWNDPDILLLGSKNFKEIGPIEAKSHFSLWAMMAAPLLLSVDVTDIPKIDPWVLSVITNKDVIAVDQDPLGKQGIVVQENRVGLGYAMPRDGTQRCILKKGCKYTQIWMKPMSHGGYTILFFNRADINSTSDQFTSERITLDWQRDLSQDPNKKFQFKDLWTKQDLGVFSKSFTTDQLKAHDVMMVSMIPVDKAN
jgi:alpha-galactosidase